MRALAQNFLFSLHSYLRTVRRAAAMTSPTGDDRPPLTFDDCRFAADTVPKPTWGGSEAKERLRYSKERPFHGPIKQGHVLCSQLQAKRPCRSRSSKVLHWWSIMILTTQSSSLCIYERRCVVGPGKNAKEEVLGRLSFFETFVRAVLLHICMVTRMVTAFAVQTCPNGSFRQGHHTKTYIHT